MSLRQKIIFAVWQCFSNSSDSRFSSNQVFCLQPPLVKTSYVHAISAGILGDLGNFYFMKKKKLCNPPFYKTMPYGVVYTVMCLLIIDGVWISNWIHCTLKLLTTINHNIALIIVTHTSYSLLTRAIPGILAAYKVRSLTSDSRLDCSAHGLLPADPLPSN
jgi:hypothetical protein